MTKSQELLEKDSAVLVAKKPSVRRSHSNPNHPATMRAKLPAMDKLLENTLLNKPDVFLTKRESEILQLIIAGRTNKEIAQTLYRAERTVEYHRNRLMRKLGVHTAADLVKHAIVMGLA